MTNHIYHHKSAPLNIGPGSAAGSGDVCLFASGTVIVDMSANCGSARMSMHMDAASLRAFAALLSEAVAALEDHATAKTEAA